jgi:flagellar L-ring protein precursor FlgH
VNWKPIVLVVAAALPVSADGLLGNETESPYAPEKPTYKLNDIIKITVNENSLGSAKAESKDNKDTKLVAALTDFVHLTMKGGGLPQLKPGLTDDLKIDGEAKYDRDDKGETTGTNRVVFTVAAKVIEVLDNGNLVIAARKEVQINEETVTMTVTGEVSPEDVSGSRTVSTDKVADVKIRRTGDGEVTDGRKRGLFSWLVGKLWPF